MKAQEILNQLRNKRIRWIAIVLMTIVVFTVIGCASKMTTASYYLIDYRPVARNANLTSVQKIPKRVAVKNFKIPRSFDSNRIIARYSSHQINYYRYSLWAVRPQIAVADLLTQHINTYGLFAKCQREFLDERPDYEISGEIYQIEKYQSELYTAAHLKMVFELHDYNNGNLLVKHEFDREMPIPPDNMTIFAKAVSDLVQEEAELFLFQVVTYFNTLPPDSTASIAQ